jgi:hypothetical protein
MLWESMELHFISAGQIKLMKGGKLHWRTKN